MNPYNEPTQRTHNEPMNTKKGLNLLDSTMLIMGGMIGSGIFIVSAGIAKQVGSPGLLLAAWVVTGIITVFGALSYGELAAMFPQAGGQYVYLRTTYGKLVAFLYGWALFMVIQTGTSAAVGVAFAKFAGVFFGGISAENVVFSVGSIAVNTQQLLAIVLIWGLTIFNYGEVKLGAMLQNILTFVKIAALLGMIGVGLWYGMTAGSTANFSPALPDNLSWGMVTVFIAAMTGSLFSADAWNNVTFTAGELNNPRRDLPLSLIIGTGSVIGLYFLANVAYLYAMPIQDIANAPQERVGTALMGLVLGDTGKYLMAAAIMVSTLGCLNGVLMTAARVYYTMAKDGLFFKQAATLNKAGVPAVALTFQAAWATVLALSGSYGNLLDYIMFTVLLFYILTVACVFILRKRIPDAERPYKALGYPFIPAIYILLTAIVCAVMLYTTPLFAGGGLLIILAGIPIYYAINR
jgi:basic amino acid/polyamine antiporter, APA family